MANQRIIPILDPKEKEENDNKLKWFESGGMAGGVMIGSYFSNIHDLTSLGVIGAAEFFPTYFFFQEREHSPLMHYRVGLASTALALKLLGKLDLSTFALTSVGMVGGCFAGSTLAEKF